jgi:organic radical activating enzyme
LPNILLTSECNNSCEFCFAGYELKKEFKSDQIENLLSFIKSFNSDCVNIIGGEPTLHKDFLSVVAALQDSNYRVAVFTNGKIRKEITDSLTLLPYSNLSICVNRSQGSLTGEITDLYRKLGYCIMLSVTIFRQNQNISHLFEEINTYKLHKSYRLGIAMPSFPDFKNRYIHYDEYKAISGEIIEMIKEGIKYGIRPGFDCGFPYCFFDEGQKQFLAEHEINFNSYCGIIPDICSDNTLIPCLALKMFKYEYSDKSTWNEIKPLFENLVKSLKKLPLFKKCKTCNEILNCNCSGGCAAFRIKGRGDEVIQ